jgi:Na+-transporting methylmalonyl-CoA/oxaloacetate decarboxylase gamma subunit
MAFKDVVADAKRLITLLLGVGAVIAFGILVVYLTKLVSADQTQWDRLVYLYGGVEAIALAAVGYFFGKEVNRERAEKAEDKASKSDNAATKAHGDKRAAEEKLSGLFTVIDEKRKRKSGTSSLEEILSRHLGQGVNADVQRGELQAFMQSKQMPSSSIRSDPDWDELAAIAQRLMV